MSKPMSGVSASRKRRKGNPSPEDGVQSRFPIVGIGASAGGLEAFVGVLKNLPLDTGLGFVLVQHLDPLHESSLTQLLTRATSMRVQEITDNLEVEPNNIYIIPPNTTLGIAGGVLELQPRAQTGGAHHSIDLFFESLAQDRHELAIGVILSGTASDGTLGLEAIKAEGGITLAQDDSARYDSMPRSAIAAGCVDFVLSPEGIAKELARIAKHPYVAGETAALLASEEDRASATAHEEEETALPAEGHGTPRTGARKAGAEAEEAPARPEENGFKKILLLLRNHCGVDFTLYKSTTIRRRVLRRIVLNKKNTPEDYADFLRGNSEELDALYSDALISVTSFFRNPEAFDILQRKVFPSLLQHPGNEPLRVWVLGCSTGQEAYSIAMTFVESEKKASRMRTLQVFATDLNGALLDKARHGLYAKNLAQDVSPERLREFFLEEDGGYRIIKPLREMVVFARQNLISDPPFSRMDLICCRNLLIYLEPDLQKKVLPIFHYALKPGGFLFLGASESIGGFTTLFHPVDKKHRIYSKTPAPTPAFKLPVKKTSGAPASLDIPESFAIDRGRTEPTVKGFHPELNAQREADRVMLNQFAPPGVLVDKDLQVLQFRGETSLYLKPPTGKPIFDVLKMAREGLVQPLRDAFNKAKKQKDTVRLKNVRIQSDGQIRNVNLEVIPLKNMSERSFLILFDDPAKQLADPGRPENSLRTSRPAGKKQESRRINELETELSQTRDYLQSMHEQHESANEEFQAYNEEIQSANEELQSLNEELETSKEELESANEELITLNEEMANRNTELVRLNSDLVNLQVSTKLPIVLIGRDLVIRRFSAQAEKLFNLQAEDIGRGIGKVGQNLLFPREGRLVNDLEFMVTQVIETVRERECEVLDKEGNWYLLRVSPYISLHKKVEGAVLVLINIDELKLSKQAAVAARDYAESIVRTVRDPLLILNSDLSVHTANDAFYKTFEVSPAESEGRLIYDLGNGQWNIPGLRELLDEILPRNSFFENFEVTHDFVALGRRIMLLNARKLESVDTPGRILLGIQDVTEQLQNQMATRTSLSRNRALVDASAQIVWTTDPTGAVVEDSPSWRAFTGQTYEQWKGFGWLDAMHPEDQERVRELWQRTLADRVPVQTEYRLRHVSGEWRWMAVRAVPSLKTDGSVSEWIGMNVDISERKQAEEALRESESNLRDFIENASEGLHWTDPAGMILWANQAELDMLGYTQEEYVGHNIAEFHANRSLMEDILSGLRSGEVFNDYEAQMFRKDGSIRHVLINSNGFFKNGKFVHSRCFTRDITERKNAEEKLHAKNEELARFNRLMVDRELRMIELKKEINELHQRQGQAAPYPLNFEQKEKGGAPARDKSSRNAE